MTLIEAQSFADRINRGETPTTLIKHHSNLVAKVVRILPAHIDPPNDNDNGWDVEITVN
jgi:hypothetical protein